MFLFLTFKGDSKKYASAHKKYRRYNIIRKGSPKFNFCLVENKIILGLLSEHIDSGMVEFLMGKQPTLSVITLSLSLKFVKQNILYLKYIHIGCLVFSVGIQKCYQSSNP